LIEHFDGLIHDDIIHVATESNGRAIGNEFWIIVNALAAKNDPLVKTSWIRIKMPFPSNKSAVPASAQTFWKSHETFWNTRLVNKIRAIAIGDHTMNMGVYTG
jgi:hypothetical protein